MSSALVRGLLAALLLSGCIARHRYAHHVTAPLPSSATHRTELVEVIDARFHGRPIPNPIEARREELADVRAAVEAHALALGVANGRPLAAPRAAADIDAILAFAIERGADEVAFVRFHAGRLYLGAAIAIFDLVIVDAHTRDVLHWRSTVQASRSDPSPFDSGERVLHEALRGAVGALFASLEEARAAGYPEREFTSLLGAAMVGQPQVHVAGGRVVGIGWSFEHVDGWEATGDLASSSGGMRAPDGTYVSVVLEPTHQDARSYAETNVSTLRDIATVHGSWATTLAGRPATAIETSYRNGMRAVQRVWSSQGGIGVVASCVAPEAVFESRRAECERVLETVTLQLGE